MIMPLDYIPILAITELTRVAVFLKSESSRRALKCLGRPVLLQLSH